MRTYSSAALLAAAVLSSGALVAATPPAYANTAPRIVSARMGDADHDDHADRVTLSYSEAVVHTKDADGTYPFTVGTYAIAQVSFTNTRTLVILLREKPTRDVAAHPSVTYRRTTSRPVRDLAGLEAIGQTFTGTVALDRDHDGYAATDCRPDDPAIHPGAADQPDLTFADTNCDGIDGQRTGPVFVSPAGDDAAAGTIAAPVATIDHAMAIAGSRPVYLAKGSYAHASAGTAATSLYGGYDPLTWKRSPGGTSIALTVTLSGTGALAWQEIGLTAPDGSAPRAVDLTDATLVAGRVDLQVGAAGPGAGSLALRASNSQVSWTGGSITVGPGSRGFDGGPGSPGAPGASAPAGNGGSCDGSLAPPPSPGGGSPVFAAQGGIGGAGANPAESFGHNGGTGGSGAPGGAGGATGGSQGQPGAAGANGGTGAPGAGGLPAAGSWSTVVGWDAHIGSTGAPGSPGGGGGGGGGGGAQSGPFVIDGSGNSGGGGGAGGLGGGGGSGALGGTGSIAVLLVGGHLTLTGAAVSTGQGGDGGLGGPGAIGGGGGSGGAGGQVCTGEVGAGGHGGNGGHGGTGGNGGNGAGGPSIGVLRMSGATLAQSGVSWTIGGQGTSVNHPEFNGLSAEVFAP
jgi:hypothetical protein